MLRSIWYVATRGSVFFWRTSFAAIPIPIRSSELKSSSASSCVILIDNSVPQSRPRLTPDIPDRSCAQHLLAAPRRTLPSIPYDGGPLVPAPQEKPPPCPDRD